MISSTILALALIAGPSADDGQARPLLHPLFTDHVVFQRDVPVPVWGWVEPGQRVKVDLASQTVETTADADGKWMAKFGPYPAGGPHELSVTSGTKAQTVKDILVGDVWICSGQSNMEWPLFAANNAQEEIASANHPKLRLFTVPKKIALEPTTSVDASWEVCTPETAGQFSAVGYFFGRELQRELNVPVGLIDSSWGGTICEAWVSAGSLKTMKDFESALALIEKESANPSKLPQDFAAAMLTWWKKSDPGSNDQPSWADPKFDATSWKTMPLPGHWEGKGLPEFDGIAWFRKEIMLPEGWEGKEIALSLGAIDDRDSTFVNGIEVGHMESWNAPRNYKVPAGVFKAGRNVIAVRVLDTAGLGGFAGPDKDLKLTLSGDDKAEPITLAGDWSFKASTPLGELTSPPEAESNNPNRVTVLYNGMIAPLKPFAIKGAIWYQGESNAGRASQYRTLLPTMIKDWRASFEVGDFPFYIVQLANFMEVRNEPMESGWAELREAQFLATRALPNVGIGLAIDIGDAKDIHPRNKQEVGRRLALSALANAFGKDIECSGPVFKSKEIQGNTVRLTFDHFGGGLASKGSEKLEGFAIAGEDGKFVWADATIEGETVVVSSPKVEKPVNVRYAWADNPICNLYNQVGLPAVPFRTDPPKD
jgi:sialate O-acetylesterase